MESSYQVRVANNEAWICSSGGALHEACAVCGKEHLAHVPRRVPQPSAASLLFRVAFGKKRSAFAFPISVTSTPYTFVS